MARTTASSNVTPDSAEEEAEVLVSASLSFSALLAALDGAAAESSSLGEQAAKVRLPAARAATETRRKERVFSMGHAFLQ